MICRLLLTTVLVLAGAGVMLAAVQWNEVNRQPAEWYASAEARAVADSVLLYQTEASGWPKNRDMTAPPDAAFLAETKYDHRAPTIDNDATYTQIRFLARMVTATGDTRYRSAAERGLDYLLAAQYANGGWPQYFPLIPGYYTHITFNDGAMIGVMEVLREVATARAPFAWVEEGRKTQAAEAVRRGLDCILRCQIVVNGEKTAWCAQHDEETFEPVPARKYEHVSLSGSESVGIVRFLMGVEHPSPEVVQAVQSAVRWFERAKLNGIRIDTPAAPELPHGHDRVVVADPRAPPLWARFYEIGTNRPIFGGRDSVIRYALAEVEPERRGGYKWYVDEPAKLLERDYPRWQKVLGMTTTSGAKAQAVSPAPGQPVVVAADGTGQYASLQEAISAAPMRTGKDDPRWVISVKPGTYRERIYVQRERGNISVVGEDAATTIIAYDLHANLPGPDGKPIGTFRTPTVQIDGDGMIWENITFANTAGEPGPRPDGPAVSQALALRVDGDRVVFRRCRFLGWQDTILVNRGRHYFADCYIEGNVDFIFGAATSFFDRCHIHCLKDGYITAASTPEGTTYGMVFAYCKITGAEGVKTYLGRPWRDFAKTIFIRTEMSEVVRAEGWHNWNKPPAEEKSFYAEFGSTGPGASAGPRVAWAKPITAAGAAELTPAKVLAGNDGWNPARP